MNITTNETRALQGIIDSEYRDGNHPVGHPVWAWSANPFESKKTFSGVVASLTKKGLAGSNGESVWITQDGYDVLQRMPPGI